MAAPVATIDTAPLLIADVAIDTDVANVLCSITNTAATAEFAGLRLAERFIGNVGLSIDCVLPRRPFLQAEASLPTACL
jgi:hypothetical protein